MSAMKALETLRKIELRDETEEEAQARLEFATVAYDKNLATLTPYLSKKGVWRVQLDDVGLVASIAKGPAGRPKPGEFCMIVSGPGCVPRFGSLSHLLASQMPVAKTLIKDLSTISQIKEEAHHTPGRGIKEVDEKIDEQLGLLEKRFGSLPPSKTELDLQKEEQLDDDDSDLILDNEQSFEQIVAAEEKKREKRRRQKEKKRMQQQAQDSANSNNNGSLRGIPAVGNNTEPVGS